MNGIRKIPLLLLVFGIFINTAYSQVWIPLEDTMTNKNAVETEIMESDGHSYILKVTINGLYDNIIAKDSSEYHKISIQSDHLLAERGNPALPIIKQTIAIPSGASLSASVEERRWKDVEVGKIYPAQNLDDEEFENEVFYLNENTYSKQFLPYLVNIGEDMVWRGIHNRQISVCPFKYYPKENRLSVLCDFILRVDFEHSSSSVGFDDFDKTDDYYHLFDNVASNPVQVRNHDVVSRSQPDSISNGIKYLIVVGDIPGIVNSEAMRRFRIWKAAKGYNTEVVTVPVLQNRTDYIKGLLSQKWEESNHLLRYVLFIGDSGKITPNYFTGYGTVNNQITLCSDYWYGCMDGDDDIEAEFPVGRFSVSTLQEFSNMVEKTIRYEKSYQCSNKVLLVAHSQGADNNYFQNNIDMVSSQVYTDTVSFFKAYGAAPPIGNGATNSTVVDKINQGAHIVNYRGHGSPNSWPNWNHLGESFTSSQIENINDSVNSVFLNVACNTGNIDADSCMLEIFTRSPHGAVAFIGATVDTDNDTNNNYELNLFHKLLNEGVYHIGDMNVAAHIASINPLYNRSKDNPHSYLCGSDPSLEIWTGHPHDLGDIDLVYRNDSITICTTLEENYDISMSAVDGSFIETVHASGGNCTFPKPANQFYFCISKHNCYPYFAYFDTVTNFIENIVFDGTDHYYVHSPFEIEYDYDEMETVVKKGTKVVIQKGAGGVLINYFFECEKGATFEIR